MILARSSVPPQVDAGKIARKCLLGSRIWFELHGPVVSRTLRTQPRTRYRIQLESDAEASVNASSHSESLVTSAKTCAMVDSS